MGSLGVAAIVLAGTWYGLPTRHAPMDIALTTLSFAWAVVGVALWRRARWAVAVARGVAVLAAAVGGTLVTALAWSAAHLVGLYGPVGSGGAMLLVSVALLVVPYLVVFPLWAFLALSPPRAAA